MKKIIFADFMEFDDPCNKLGNYHYAKCFAKNGYEVLWMSCLFNYLTYIKYPEVYRKRKELSKLKRHKLDENIFGFAIRSKRLYGKYPFCNKANIALENEKYIYGDVYKKFEKIGFLNVDILWISNPKQFWLTNVIKYKKLIFRIPDDFTEFGVFPNGIKEIEKKLIEKADVNFVTAKELGEKVSQYDKVAYLLPNGCDYEYFFNSSEDIPKEFVSDNKKKIIYVGAIGEWFDTCLIKKLAKEIEDANIYIIGKPKINLSDIENIVNIKILGARPYSSITQYLKNSDIGIIPFKVNKFTDRINPIKLFEYLSCGIPVVSTNMKEVVRLDSPAYIGKNNDEFIEITKRLLSKQKNDNLKFLEFAKNNSWNSRYEYIIDVLVKNGYM